MNKILYYLKNITFAIVCALFFASFSHLNMVIEGQTAYGSICLILFIAVIIELIILWRRHSKVNENNWYNGLFLITNLVFIGLYLRTCFDTSIVTVYFHNMDEKFIFLHYNLNWITLLYTILFIYPATYLTFKKPVKKKKNEK